MAMPLMIALLVFMGRASAFSLTGTRLQSLKAGGKGKTLVVMTATSAGEVVENDNVVCGPLSRQGWLKRAAGTGSMLLDWTLHPGDADAGDIEVYRSPDGSFQLSYPTGFVGFSKPLKTHKEEVNFKSEDTKGYEVGVVVDPVKLESLEKFGTPEEVGARVLKVEQGKDGTLETKLYGAFSEKQGDLTLYTLDYFVESTRGVKHFLAKVTVKDGLLYACTAQAREKDYPEVRDELVSIVRSFKVPAL